MVATYCPAAERRAVTSSPLAMNAGLSKRSAGAFRLPRRSVLRGKDAFSGLFKNGTRIAGTFTDLRFVVTEGPAPDIRVAFIAGRRLGNAVRRNRGKRLLREAYRLQQHFLDPVKQSSATVLHIGFILKNSRATYPQLHEETGRLVQKLAKMLTDNPEES
ncbi:MAG: ribonuclease P protein component [Bacteroidetes bacterium HLUCCA01]|nr:MAG: ribonuclease P protein component [Bacteroidetes bacterium HLUCCA01]